MVLLLECEIRVDLLGVAIEGFHTPRPLNLKHGHKLWCLHIFNGSTILNRANLISTVETKDVTQPFGQV